MKPKKKKETPLEQVQEVQKPSFPRSYSNTRNPNLMYAEYKFVNGLCEVISPEQEETLKKTVDYIDGYISLI